MGSVMVKVKDLMNNLKNLNPNANIGIKTIDDEYIDHLYVSFISETVDGQTYDEKNTKQVWIEAVDLCVNCQFFNNGYCIAYDKDVSDVKECYQFMEI